ncbi:MAG: TonB-dependent receptor, partial [Flavobacteriaceae bacterium]
MRNKIRSILFLCLLIFGSVSAQNLHKIQGKVLVKELKDHQQALVSLYLEDGLTLVKIEVPSANGTFEFVQIPSKNYKLSIDFPGYQAYWSEVFQVNQEDLTLPDIVMTSASTQQLSEVVITKKKALIENKIDRTVVNVEAMMTTAGGDAMDVLEKSPGIIVDQNGTITFKGKSGVQVFIDDKPTYLSGSELEAYLKSLPASTLDKIELMTNPPAKYDAAGSAGVINIVSKRSKNRGFNGSVTSRYSQGKRPSTRQGINLNYANEKVRIFGNVGYAYMNPVNDLFIFRRFKNPDGTAKSLFYQDSYLNNKTQTANAKVGMDYYLSKRTTLGVGVSGLLKSNLQKNQVNSRLTNPAGVVDSTIVANNREKERFGNLGLNLNFRHDLDTLGQKVTADFDYLNYDTSTDQTFKNFVYQPDGSQSSQDELRGYLPTKINIYSFKTDFAKPLKNNGSFEAGYKISYSKTDNQADYRDVVAGTEIPNYDTSNHFKYDEMINAVYLNYNTTYKRFTFQTGLRLEHTYSKGNQLGNVLKPASTFKRDYTNLFPTAYVQYQLDSIGNHLISVNYGRRINRPYFQDLNPFVSPLDKFTFYAGNPYLNPSFANNYELSYRYKGIFSTTL